MKKATRILSSLLACLMVLSALPMFASADDESTPEALFVDFESFTVEPDVKKGTDDEWIAAGFNKGMALNYNNISGNTTSGFAAKVVEDDVMGKAWQTPAKSNELYMGVGFDTPVTSGAVKLAFTIKGAENEGFPSLIYAQKMGTSYGQKIDTDNDGEKETDVRVSANMGQIKNGSPSEIFLLGSGADDIAGEKTSLENDMYYDVEWIVDVDTDTRYLYVDGIKVGEYSSKSAKIDSMQGFYFLHTSKEFDTPRIDNILLTAYDIDSENMNLLKTIPGDGRIKFVFDEVIDENALSDGDIFLKEAGGDDIMAVSEVKVIGNTLEVFYDATMAIPGREYILTANNLISVNGGKKIVTPFLISFLLKNGLNEIRETITPLDSFDDINPDDYVFFNSTDHSKTWNTETATKEFMLDRIYPMAYTTNMRNNWGNAPSVFPIKVDDFAAFDGHDTVLALNSYINYDIAYNHSYEDEYGIEVYEFDFATKNTGRTTKKFKLLTGTKTSPIDNNTFDVSYATDGTWHHIKLVYDTVNDTAQLFINDKASSVKTGVTQYYALDMGTNYCAFDVCHPESEETKDKGSQNWVVLDNFESYILIPTLAVDKVRFVNLDGSKAFTDTISPETNAIDITFSDEADESIFDKISVMTEDNEPVDVEDYILSDDGRTLTLSIPGMFPENTNYIITIPEFDFEYKFKTPEGRFAIVDIKATNSDDSELTFGTTATDGDAIKISAGIVNTIGINRIYTVIYAYYNDDMLVAMDRQEYEVAETDNFETITWTAETVPGGIEYDTIKIFVWNSIDGAEALADCVVYSSNGN